MSITTIARPAVRPRGPRLEARALLAGFLIVLLATGAAGCSPDMILGDKQLPPDVPDPAQTKTPAGAVAAYHGALVQLRSAFAGKDNSFVPVTGLLTDELRSGDLGQLGVVIQPMLVDSRFLPEDPGIGDDNITPFLITDVYGFLQKARGQSREARGALLAYAPDSTALVGHLDAIEGYADVMLADLFCSGVPLSTLDFGADYTYQPGSSTEEVYQHAVALFDSALAAAGDSANILNLARVGKGRALVALGQYAAAAQAVADVPDDFVFVLDYDITVSPGSNATGFTNRSFAYYDFGMAGLGLALTMVDREGENGLDYLSSGDPRVPWVNAGVNNHGLTVTRPARYPVDGTGSVVLASGVEARLIQAEAALQANDASWLVTLNALRTDGTFDTQPDAQDPATTDTLWHAGSGGVPGLAPLQDPVAPDARVSLLFHERAFWLFLTGHRQGDLRRLIRQYGRQSDTVYPRGTYPGAYNTYGTDVTAPIPGAERVSNPRFTGCRSRGA